MAGNHYLCVLTPSNCFETMLCNCMGNKSPLDSKSGLSLCWTAIVTVLGAWNWILPVYLNLRVPQSRAIVCISCGRKLPQFVASSRCGEGVCYLIIRHGQEVCDIYIRIDSIHSMQLICRVAMSDRSRGHGAHVVTEIREEKGEILGNRNIHFLRLLIY